MNTRTIKTIAASLLFSSTLVWAGNDFVIKAIDVQGLQRVDVGAVYNDLPVKVGDRFQDSDSGEIIRALFKSGYYSDVKLARDGDTLIVMVTERPTVGRLQIIGNKSIKTEPLLDSLRQNGMAEGLTYVPSTLDRIQQELEQQYYIHGQYGVKIDTEVTELPRNRVSIVIKIDEGSHATIRRINIVGNKAFSNWRLIRRFKLSTPGMFTWFTKADQYSKQKLAGDLENLRSFYLDRGFLNFDIDSTQVSLSPSKQEIYITVNIKEGQAYKIGEIKFAGDLILPEETLREVLTTHEGDVFSRKKINATQRQLVERLGDEGYAFAEVNPVPVADEETGLITLTFYINPKKQVYVREINISGHHLSKDEVVRRELTQLEGALASTQKISRSRNNLNLLGYFKNVSIDTVPVPGTDDQIDLEVSVDEKQSGQINGGVGYSQLDGVLFNVGLRQDNFLGSGNMVDFAFNHSKSFTSYRIGYNNPYYTLDGVSRGYDVFYQKTRLDEQNISDYTRDVWGGSLMYGIPLSEVDRLSAGVGYENIEIRTSSHPENVSQQIRDFLDDYGRKYNEYRISLGWSHNALDRAVFPTKGLATGLSGNVAMPFSDLTYYKVASNTRWYYPFWDKYVFLARGNVTYGEGYGNTSELPFFENAYAGGSGSVRGFRDNSLGPLDSLGDPIGGNLKVVGSAEVFFPIPYLELETVRTSVFIDAGNVYNTHEESLDLGQMRVSTGAAVQWLSPLGPIVFSAAKAVHKRSGDETEVFQFNIGSLY